MFVLPVALALAPATYGKLKWTEKLGSAGIAASVAANSLSSSRGGHTVVRTTTALGKSLVAWLVAREASREIFRAPKWTSNASELAPGSFTQVNRLVVHLVNFSEGNWRLHASHGFGANSLSFRRLLPMLQARCLAHDHPGFGLTQKPKALEDYKLDGSVASSFDADVYVGHSMGAVAALDAAIRTNARGLILIAPALTTAKARRWPLSAKLATTVFVWPLRLLLRRIVHTSPNFWKGSLGACWSKQSRQNNASLDYAADQYMLASKLRGWDLGLVKFAASRLAYATDDAANLDRAAQLVRQNKLDVLVIHGEEDIVVPAANSRRIADLLQLPSLNFIAMDGIGHCPHEENPALVAQQINDFLRRLRPF